MEESPYNENNKWITEEYILNIMNKYNILNFKITNINFYKTAFTHKSYLKNSDNNIQPPNTIDLQEESYERMEWLGDALLEMLISKYLYERYNNNLVTYGTPPRHLINLLKDGEYDVIGLSVLFSTDLPNLSISFLALEVRIDTSTSNFRLSTAILSFFQFFIS